MKKLMLMMFLIAGFGIAAHAQDVKKTPAHMAKQLVKKLNLTADQQSKIDVIMQTKATQLDSLNGNAQLSKKELHKKKKTINDTAIEQINNILTADQQKTYADFRTEQAEKMKAKKDAAAKSDSTTPAAPPAN